MTLYLLCLVLSCLECLTYTWDTTVNARAAPLPRLTPHLTGGNSARHSTPYAERTHRAAPQHSGQTTNHTN